MSRRLATVLAFAGVSFIWGSTWVFIKIGLDLGWPPFLLAGVRNLIASGLLFAGLATLRRPLPHRWAEWWPPLIWGCLNGIGMGLVTFGEQYITSGRAAVLTAAVPLFSLLLGRLWLGERITWRRVLAVAAGFAGVTFAFADRLTGAGVAADAGLARLGQFVVLAGALFYGLSYVFSARHQRGMDVYNNTAAGLLGAAGIQLLLALTGPAPGPGVSTGPAILALLYLAVFGSAVAFVLLFYMLQHLSPVYATYPTLLNPLVAVALGALMLGEVFTLRAGTGLLLVLGGVWLVSRPERPVQQAAAAD